MQDDEDNRELEIEVNVFGRRSVHDGYSRL